MRWLEAERGLDFGGDYDALWRWSVDELEDFWASIWEYFGVRASAPYERVLAEPRDARRRAGSRAPAQLRREPARRQAATTRLAIQHASELRELDALTWGELRDAGRRASPPALRALGVEPRRPGRRLHAEPPRGARRLPRHRLDRRRSGRAARRTSAPARSSTASPRSSRRCCFAVDGYRYNGRDFDRRDVVAGLLAEMPTVEHTVVLPYLDPDPDLAALRAAIAWDELLRRRAPGAELAFEQVPVRPPALGPLLLRHDRAAEGDRPGPRRDPARAAEEAQPAPRRPGRRPRLLVHDHRLDDVELPRRRPAHRRLDRALRRQPGPSRHGRALGPRRATPGSPASAPRPATSPPA